LLIDPVRRIVESATLQRVMAQSRHPFAYVVARTAVWAILACFVLDWLALGLNILYRQAAWREFSFDWMGSEYTGPTRIVSWLSLLANLLIGPAAILALLSWTPRTLRLLCAVWLVRIATWFVLRGISASDTWIMTLNNFKSLHRSNWVFLGLEFLGANLFLFGLEIVMLCLLWRHARKITETVVVLSPAETSPVANESNVLHYDSIPMSADPKAAVVLWWAVAGYACLQKSCPKSR
jgi:hypothetical protein